MSGVQRYCPWGDHWVPTWEAVEVGAEEPASGPGMPVYACWTHVETRKLRPIAAAPDTALIGRRDGAPIVPGAADAS